MAMRPRIRKLVLSAHLMFSIGWIGAVLAYFALGLTATSSRVVDTVRGAWAGMEVIGWYVIVPLALISLLTGLVMALGTRWGLFRHYWVLFSFVLTCIATAVLLLHMPDVSVMAEAAKQADAAALERLGGDLLHPGLGLVVLVAIQVLNVYKPPGMTRYGWRKQQAQQSSPR